MLKEGEYIEGSILDQEAIFFGQTDDSNMSAETMVQLRIKDFAE